MSRTNPSPGRGKAVGTLALLCLCLSASRLHAQAVQGRLTDLLTGQPSVGALVLLQDSTGRQVSKTVSSAEGRYRLRAGTPGSYLVRVLRIGYAPFSGPVVLEQGRTLTRDWELSGVIYQLPEITVAGVPRCGPRVSGDTLLEALWSEAGTALGITAQTVASHSFRFETVLESRDIDRLGNATPVEEVNKLNVSAWPVRSPPPDTLLASGFVENLDDLDKGPTWYGPDADFLLSSAFFARHCFQTVPAGPDNPPEWVGLAFAPEARDQRVDIKGTLWLDRQTAELRRLDFQYTRLPKWARGEVAGGELRFAPLPVGGWIVQRWMLRVPVPQRTEEGSAHVYGYRESGGHVTAVLDASGKLVQSYEH
jgi:hypothetical protein